MHRFEHQGATERDGAIEADRSAEFIFKLALGTPKSLATVKAASDRFDRSTRALTVAPPLVPGMDCLTIEPALP